MNATNVVSAILLLAGACFAALGGLGLVRFPDVLTRLHAATKPQVVGLLLILAGVGTRFGDATTAAQLVLVAAFQLITVPITAQTVGRIACRLGELRRDLLLRDELGEKTRTD
ncbi:MAG: Na+/H+ antiporter subunit G [Streptosporangiales bacterium]|nr:Na+/H+ antiporter subunit G [Streptosporangiales bacterium]